MCKITTQNYTQCKCYNVSHEICAPHIEHTRLQRDNDPCPGLIYAFSTNSGRRCVNHDVWSGGYRACEHGRDVFYQFQMLPGATGFGESKKQRQREYLERIQRKWEQEDRDSAMRERDARDQAAHDEEKRQNKRMKREKLENGDDEVDMSSIPAFPSPSSSNSSPRPFWTDRPNRPPPSSLITPLADYQETGVEEEDGSFYVNGPAQSLCGAPYVNDENVGTAFFGNGTADGGFGGFGAPGAFGAAPGS